jgi:hypothetical protein
MKQTFSITSTVLFCAFVVAAFSADDTFQGNSIKAPFEQGSGGKAKTTSTQILYHNGPIMNGNNNVYLIYYGNFAASTQSIINDFLSGLSGSPQYGVNGTYGTPVSYPIQAGYTFMPPTSPGVSNGWVHFDSYSQGTSLSNSSIPTIVSKAIAGGLPADSNGVYMVLTSADVKVAGFCNSYCAYHNTSTSIYGNMHIRYALIPDPTQRCSACNGGIAVYNDNATPNGDMGADTMTDDIIHELSETVTDPDISAWYTQNGAENGDLCNYVYENSGYSANSTTFTVDGKTYTYHYNAVLNNRKYLVQLIWKNDGAGYCSAGGLH